MLSQLSAKYGKEFSYCLPSSSPLGNYYLKLCHKGVGEAISCDGNGVSRLSAPVYGALREKPVKIISSKYKLSESFLILDTCFAGTAAEISTVVPAVEMRFEGGTELKLAAKNVVLEVENGRTCLSFAANSDIRDSIGIIGNQQLQCFMGLLDGPHILCSINLDLRRGEEK